GGRLRRRRPSDPPGQARWTLAAARTALRASRGVRARPAEPARRDRPGDRTDPHHGCPDRRRGKHDRPVRGAGARQFDDEPHPRLPRQRPLPPRPGRPGLAATAREADRPALRAVLLSAPQPDRAAVESDARERHPQQVLRQIPRLRRSRAGIPARNRAEPVRRILVVHHRQFPRHQPEGFSDPRVTPLYHYHSKEEIVADLFAEFRREIETTLAAPEARLPNAEDCWLFLHLMFEAIWKYRSIYRDINNLVARYHVIEVQFRRILAHKIRVAEQILAGLVKAGQMRAQPAEITTLAENIVLAASYWMSFAFACDPRATQDDRTLARGGFHVIALAAPYLEPRERELFGQLAKRYIA